MMFVLYDPALNAGDNDLNLIDQIVNRVQDGVHRLHIPKPKLLEDSAWFATARKTLRRLVKEAVASPMPRAAKRPGQPHAKQVHVYDPTKVAGAAKLAYAPLVVLVEDRESDGVLLEILLEECATQGLAEVWAKGQACTPRAIEIDTSGGINAMPSRIKRAIQDALSAGHPVRLFVLCDSDRRWPNDQGNPSRKSLEQIQKLCDNHNIPFHVLRKRCAENYIPDPVIRAVQQDPRNKNRQERFNALLRRTAPQRDHFPIS